MLINVTCECGKKTGVVAAMAGKTIRCPKCGQTVDVPYDAAPAAPPSKKQKEPGAGIHISSGTLTLLILIVAGVGVTLFFQFGPSRVWKQWRALEPKADSDVRDVVSFALQAYISNHDIMFKLFRGRPQAEVEGDINFVEPYLSVTLPEKMDFTGVTGQGGFAGTYDTQTGEIAAHIGYGGHTIDSGLLTTAAPEGFFDITGREANGSPQAESDGQKMSIYYAPVIPREGP